MNSFSNDFPFCRLGVGEGGSAATGTRGRSPRRSSPTPPRTRACCSTSPTPSAAPDSAEEFDVMFFRTFSCLCSSKIFSERKSDVHCIETTLTTCGPSKLLEIIMPLFFILIVDYPIDITPRLLCKVRRLVDRRRLNTKRT